jgi:hypothetical protein
VETEVSSGAAGNHAEEAVTHVEEKSCIGVLEVDYEIEATGHFKVID